MCRVLSIDPGELPVIWDADFMYGPKNAAGEDTYVLCEINISSVYPFPDEALGPLAEETLRRLRARAGREARMRRGHAAAYGREGQDHRATDSSPASGGGRGI